MGDVQQHYGGEETTGYVSQQPCFFKVGAGDEIYKYDRQQQQSLLAAKPWEKDPHFFKVPFPNSHCHTFHLQDIKISALALLKMVMHARSGGNLEIMGLLLGKVGGE